MLDDYRPPTWKDRLLHPLSIAAILLVGVGGSVWGYEAWDDHQRARQNAAVEPLEAEWEVIRGGAVPRLARIEAALAGAPAPTPQRCEELAATIEVVHRPVLQALAAGERFARPDAPYWLSSSAYRYLAGTSTPSLDEASYRARNDIVTAALARPCVAVLDTELAEGTRMVDDRSFEGGGVVGWLRVVCLPESEPESAPEPAPRIACQAHVASQALLAVVVEQQSARAQASANAMAASDSAAREHWKAALAVLAEVGPKLVVSRED